MSTPTLLETVVAPAETITYSKGTQTLDDELSIDMDESETTKAEEHLIARLRQEIESEIRQNAKEVKDRELARKTEAVKKEPGITSLARVEKDSILSSTSFSDFVDRSYKVLERALNEDYDILHDYTQVKDEDETRHGQEEMHQIHAFQSNLTKNRMVTSIDWSLRFKELLLASYNKDSFSSHQPPGIVHIWNTHMTQPEFTFNASSEITVAKFSPFHPNLIIGGSFSGQILLWDTRAKCEAVLQTPPSGKGHTHPIVGLHLIGTSSANNVMSVSSDGMACAWSTDMLAQPQELLELTCPPPTKIEELSPMCTSFSRTDTSVFMVGGEDGVLYSVNRQDRAGTKAGVDSKTVYRGHFAPISGVNHHVAKGPIDLSDLVLTSSLDWTVKLWRAKQKTAISTSSSSIESPLLTFEKEDIVYDVAWSPSRPSVFACVLGSGECHVHDICQDAEVALLRGAPSSSSRSLNKVAWDRDEGRRLAVGGLDGVLSVFDVGEAVSGKDGATSENWFNLSARLKMAR